MSVPVSKGVLEACRRTGLHRSVLGRLYRDETATISFDTLDRLCAGLDCDMSKIIQYVPEDQMTPEDVERLKQRNQFVKKSTEQVYKYRNKE